MKGNNITCSECGAILTEGNIHSFEGATLCEECLDRITTICDNCGRRIWRENAEGDSTYILCSRCYENSYTHCEECNRLIHNEDAVYFDDDDYPYCSECYEKLNNRAIKKRLKAQPLLFLLFTFSFLCDARHAKHGNKCYEDIGSIETSLTSFACVRFTGCGCSCRRKLINTALTAAP